VDFRTNHLVVVDRLAEARLLQRLEAASSGQDWRLDELEQERERMEVEGEGGALAFAARQGGRPTNVPPFRAELQEARGKFTPALARAIFQAARSTVKLESKVRPRGSGCCRTRRRSPLSLCSCGG
jgi:hypothetical protein